jgi:hypothetical protein
MTSIFSPTLCFVLLVYCQQVFRVGNGPIGLAFNKNGKLFVANYGSNSISTIVDDVVENTFITALSKPYFVAFDSVGSLYVSNMQKISQFNADALVASMFGGAALSAITPTGLAFDSNDNLHVHEYTNGSIRKLNSSGSLIVLASRVSVGEFVGLSFDVAGSLYVPSSTANTIVKITSDGRVVTLNGEFRTPIGVVVDCVGNMYVANRDGNSVSKVFSNGTLTTYVKGTFDSPRGLVLDSNGNLYVSNYNSNSVAKIAPPRMGMFFFSCCLTRFSVTIFFFDVDDAHGPRFGDVGCPPLSSILTTMTSTTKKISATTPSSTILQSLTATPFPTFRSTSTSSATTLSTVNNIIAKDSTISTPPSTHTPSSLLFTSIMTKPLSNSNISSTTTATITLSNQEHTTTSFISPERNNGSVTDSLPKLVIVLCKLYDFCLCFKFSINSLLEHLLD